MADAKKEELSPTPSYAHTQRKMASFYESRLFLCAFASLKEGPSVRPSRLLKNGCQARLIGGTGLVQRSSLPNWLAGALNTPR